MTFTLPTPAQRWAALKEWEALRRRWWKLPKAALFVRPAPEEPKQ